MLMFSTPPAKPTSMMPDWSGHQSVVMKIVGQSSMVKFVVVAFKPHHFGLSSVGKISVRQVSGSICFARCFVSGDDHQSLI